VKSELSSVDNKVVELLLTCCDNAAIANELGMKERTTKARFTRMFRCFEIQGASSIKSVRLATRFHGRRPIPKNTGLAYRERVVTELVRRGLRNRQIAERLGTTEEAVKNWLRRIFNKTGMGSRLELALWTSR
jgi:DNA-binding NarL/FixJ family response regulator